MARQKEVLDLFNDLYDKTYLDVSKYVVCNCNNINDVSDIIQSIYLEVFKLVKNKKEVNLPYIMGISKNKLKDYYRFYYKLKLFNKNNDDNLDSIPSNFNLEESFINKYDTNKVWKYLKNKNIMIFKVFYLYYNLGLSIKEIAHELNISESNVKHYLYRTLKELNNI